MGTLRNETGEWPKRGPSQDGGAGSNAKKLLAGMKPEHVELVKTTYESIIAIVKGLPGPVQRAACSAAASDFRLATIIAKSEEVSEAANQPTIMVEAFERAKAEAAKHPSRKFTLDDYQAMTERHAKVISGERKVAREVAEKRKSDKASNGETETTEVIGVSSDTPPSQ